jgi:Male sterility protein
LFEVFPISQLIRSKKTETPSSRLIKLFTAPIFADLDQSSLDKVVAIAGDITLPGLGISKEVKFAQHLKMRIQGPVLLNLFTIVSNPPQKFEFVTVGSLPPELYRGDSTRRVGSSVA